MAYLLILCLLFMGTAEAAYIPTTPLATSTPADTPTPVPTATLVPTATPRATDTPIPAPTLVPTATPQPAPTLVPTATPQATATPSEPRPAYTVGTLPTCNGGSKYTQVFVSDAVACTFAAVLTGGSTQACPVFCDGANWIGG